MYDLVAVVAHQGRSAEGGHYIGWVKFAEGPLPSLHFALKVHQTLSLLDLWYKFDDADVSTCHDEDIPKLVGGGDWPIAYLLLYRAVDKLE